jgi:protein-tyrosine phosphatase
MDLVLPDGTRVRACGIADVEVGCRGGLGRTGTVLAWMAVLAGLGPNEAVAWVRGSYDVRAVETADQERWVEWFAAQGRRVASDP